MLLESKIASQAYTTALNGDARSPDGLGVDPRPLNLFDPLGYVDDALRASPVVVLSRSAKH